MEFKKGKKVRVVAEDYSFEKDTIVRMWRRPQSINLFIDMEGRFINFKDCEEIEQKPTHYKTREVNGMDVIDLVKHWQLNFNEGNVLKYLLRDKGQDIEDLEKIIDYAQRDLKNLRNL